MVQTLEYDQLEWSIADSQIEGAALDRALNAAIADADISQSLEAYLEIVDRFYAGDVKVTTDWPGEPVTGKARLRSLLLNFLIPLHVLAEVGGLSVSVRYQSIPTDIRDSALSAWQVRLTGVTGSSCVVTWRALRKWHGSTVTEEHHYDRHVEGGPLGIDDLDFGVLKLTKEEY